MKITYVMGVYKTVVMYSDAKGYAHTRRISTRSNSEETAEAMALGKVFKENGKDGHIRLMSVRTMEIKEALNVTC